MNILDENVPASQRARLLSWRIRIRQIGYKISDKGIQDDQVIPLLQSLGRVTFFTLDKDFADIRLSHSSYCLVFLDVDDHQAADYVRRVLKHPSLEHPGETSGRSCSGKRPGRSYLAA